jgi:serine 3-dehydrogenase
MTKTAMITGATSLSGIKYVDSAGWRVIATDAARGSSLAKELDSARPPFAMKGERLSGPGCAAGAVHDIDLLINNAGLAPAPRLRERQPGLESDDRNQHHRPVNLTHKLKPTLTTCKAQSSTSVLWASPYQAACLASKAFVRVSLGLRSDPHGTGVRVTSVEPGRVETEYAGAHRWQSGTSDKLTRVPTDDSGRHGRRV